VSFGEALLDVCCWTTGRQRMRPGGGIHDVDRDGGRCPPAVSSPLPCIMQQCTNEPHGATRTHVNAPRVASLYLRVGHRWYILAGESRPAHAEGSIRYISNYLFVS